jgi:hypothetical protein
MSPVNIPSSANFNRGALRLCHTAFPALLPVAGLQAHVNFAKALGTLSPDKRSC